MKILLVSSYLPYPLFSGGHIRLFNIIKRLTEKNHQVTLICEKRISQTDTDIAEVAKICKAVFTVQRKKQWSFENIAHTATSKDAFLISGHTNPDLQRKITEVLSNETFDLIHVETSYVMQNIPSVSLPIVLVEHNIEYQVYERFMNQSPLFLRPLLAIDIAKLKKIEIAFWKRATHIITVSEKEKNVIGLSNVSIVPNGVDTKVFTMKKDLHVQSKLDANILFIGDFKWIQNKDSIRWIVRDIYPHIIEYVKNAKKITLWVVGKHIPKNIIDTQKDENIICDENSEKSTEAIFKEADVLLAPIRVGGGTQYKILEAMASGTPVVTTMLGTSGIQATNGKEILVGESTKELARLTAKVLEDDELYEQIARNARLFVEKNYTWDVIVNSLEKVYQTVLGI